jgi:anaerobic ribonucleoside-triphosphate reductase activating protein
MAVKTILEAVPFGDIQGVTVSGGEPFDQAEELEELLHGIRILNLHTLVYTGFTYEELVSSPVKAVRNTLNLIDMLIDGPYQIVNPPKMRWTGSGNQRIIELKNGQIIKNDEFVKDAFIAHENGEIHIANDGSIIATGIFNSEFLQQEG